MIVLTTGEDTPPQGKSVVRWFRSRLALFLNQQVDPIARLVQNDRDLWKAVRNTYVEDFDRYTWWQPATEFTGRGHSAGAYVFREGTVLRDLPEIVHECANELSLQLGPAAAAVPTVPLVPKPTPLPPIDIDTALAGLAKPDRHAPFEKGALHLLSREGHRRHLAKIRRVWLRMPRVCRGCGSEFLPKVEVQASCETCKATRHRRCIRCGEAFTARHGKVKSCDPCLEKQREADTRPGATVEGRRGGNP